jgi:AraC-like DNA-binding protein
MDEVPRAVVALGRLYPPAFELGEHRHRRAQFLYAASGVMVVSTPHGAWVAPPERGVWIPGETPHAVKMVGSVQTRSVLIEAGECAARSRTCEVVAVSPLLRQLLLEAFDVPTEYDLAGRDGLVMSLLLNEIDKAPPAALAELCQAFLNRPQANATIDGFADRLAMNRRRFTRLFRQETGLSFGEWRQRACLAVALPRLAAGEAVTTIALDLGYEGAGNFSTMFKRQVGVAPSLYLPHSGPSVRTGHAAPQSRARGKLAEADA